MLQLLRVCVCACVCACPLCFCVNQISLSASALVAVLVPASVFAPSFVSASVSVWCLRCVSAHACVCVASGCPLQRGARTWPGNANSSQWSVRATGAAGKRCVHVTRVTLSIVLVCSMQRSRVHWRHIHCWFKQSVRAIIRCGMLRHSQDAPSPATCSARIVRTTCAP